MTIHSVYAIPVIRNIRIITLWINDCTFTFRVYFVLLFVSCLQWICVSSISQVTFTVTENCAKNYVVGDMSVYRVPSNATSPSKVFSMESEENDQFKELFLIGTQTGLIRVNRPIDRESICPKLTATSGTCSVTLLITVLNDIMNVIIIIVDENDNAPTFAQSSVRISIKESSPIGTKTYLTHAKDSDSIYNGIGEYSVTSNIDTHTFQLHYNSSVIYLELIDSIDYEVRREYLLTLSVCDIGSPRLCSSQTVTINIVDVNDNYPEFSKHSYLAIINEDFPPGKQVLQVEATDRDSRQYGLVKYRFSSNNNEATKWFRLDSGTGKLFLIRSIDGQIRNIKFVVEAYDNGVISNVNRTMVTVHINDINNHSPEIKIRRSTFPSTIIDKGLHRTEVSFFENNPRNSDVVFVVVSDDDSDENGLVHCRMESRSFELRQFNINKNKVIYRLVVIDSMDCEVQKRFQLIINCSDSGKKPKINVQTLDIVIGDVNEFSARFNQSSYAASIRENSVTFGIAMPIVDEDCTVDYSIDIEDKYARAHFRFVIGTQQLVLSSPLDYEARQSIMFTVKVIDKGADKKVLYSTTRIDITVIDVNDNCPRLEEPSTFHVSEGARVGSIIGRLHANDSDHGQNAKVQFNKQQTRFDGDSFYVTSDGIVTLATTLDRERQEVYLVLVELRDFGVPPLSSTGTVTITVTDVNDNGPQWVFPTGADHKVNESVYSPDGAIITRVHATDADAPGQNNITYHLAQPQDAPTFSLHPIKGELSFRTSPRAGTFTLDLVASDNGVPALSNRTRLVVYVTDRHDGSSPPNDQHGSRSYFTIVAVVPVLILICVLVLILCLLLVVRRRATTTKNRRGPTKGKGPDSTLMKVSNVTATNEKLLVQSMADLGASLPKSHRLDTLDLTQTKPLPKVSYQCLIGNDLDVCSADSGQGASEEDFNNYFMLKSNDNYNRPGLCSQHCCSSLPENSIAHFLCSSLPHQIMYPQPQEPYPDRDAPSPLAYGGTNSKNCCPSPNVQQNIYNMTCVASQCNLQC